MFLHHDSPRNVSPRAPLEGPHGMPECPFCGAHLVRRHRLAYQKLIYADAYRCKQCGHKTFRWQPALRLDRWVLFSRHARCPNCGDNDVHRAATRDRLEPTSKHLLSRLQHLLRAPLNKCIPCRLQFYDMRPIEVVAVEHGGEADVSGQTGRS